MSYLEELSSKNVVIQNPMVPAMMEMVQNLLLCPPTMHERLENTIGYFDKTTEIDIPKDHKKNLFPNNVLQWQPSFGTWGKSSVTIFLPVTPIFQIIRLQ